MGTMVQAICGAVFPVTKAPKPGSPVCPRCQEIYDSLSADRPARCVVRGQAVARRAVTVDRSRVVRAGCLAGAVRVRHPLPAARAQHARRLARPGTGLDRRVELGTEQHAEREHEEEQQRRDRRGDRSVRAWLWSRMKVMYARSPAEPARNTRIASNAPGTPRRHGSRRGGARWYSVVSPSRAAARDDGVVARVDDRARRAGAALGQPPLQQVGPEHEQRQHDDPDHHRAEEQPQRQQPAADGAAQVAHAVGDRDRVDERRRRRRSRPQRQHEADADDVGPAAVQHLVQHRRHDLVDDLRAERLAQRRLDLRLGAVDRGGAEPAARRTPASRPVRGTATAGSAAARTRPRRTGRARGPCHPFATVRRNRKGSRRIARSIRRAFTVLESASAMGIAL